MKTKAMRFTPYFEWCEIDSEGCCKVGITDFAQKTLGEIVYLELPAIGERVTKDEPCLFIESRKSIVDILAPLSGEVVRTNQLLLTRSGIINQSPYQDGWLLAIRVDSQDEWNSLLEHEPI